MIRVVPGSCGSRDVVIEILWLRCVKTDGKGPCAARGVYTLDGEGVSFESKGVFTCSTYGMNVSFAGSKTSSLVGNVPSTSNLGEIATKMWL